MSQTITKDVATLGSALKSVQSIETKVSGAFADTNVTATDVAAIATKVAGVTSTFSAANLTHVGTVASAAALMPVLGEVVGSIFPAYAIAAKAVSAALTGLLSVFGIFFARKAAVADPTTSAIVAPVAKATTPNVT